MTSPGRDHEAHTEIAQTASGLQILGTTEHRISLGPQCPTCGTRFQRDDIPAEFYAGTGTSCGQCGAELDWWSLVRTLILDRSAFHRPLALAGANWTIATFEIEPDRNYILRLADHGIPAAARVFYMGYTPQGGGLFPIELHGNVPNRHVFPKEITLHPIRLGDQSPSRTEVAFIACWIESRSTELDLLATALDMYARGQVIESIQPASTSVESSIGRLTYDVLRRWVPDSRVAEYLQETGYGHQLNVMLPAVAGLAGALPLPDKVRGQLNRLRKLRNVLAHEGRLPADPSTEEMADMLTGVVLALRYVTLVARNLSAPATTSAR